MSASVTPFAPMDNTPPPFGNPPHIARPDLEAQADAVVAAMNTLEEEVRRLHTLLCHYQHVEEERHATLKDLLFVTMKSADDLVLRLKGEGL